MIPGGVLACFVLFFAVVGAHVGAALHDGTPSSQRRLPLQQLPRPGEPIVFLQLVAYTCSLYPPNQMGPAGNPNVHNGVILRESSPIKAGRIAWGCAQHSADNVLYERHLGHVVLTQHV